MFRKLTLGACIFLMATAAFAANKEEQRLENSGTVLQEVMNVPDNIPQNLLDKAECIIVFPSVLKAAFVVGGSYGRGAMVCRTGEHFTGPWGAPAMYALEAGSVGFQLGGEATDLVLLVMNQRGASSILDSKVKLGADASDQRGRNGLAVDPRSNYREDVRSRDGRTTSSRFHGSGGEHLALYIRTV